MKMTTLAGIVLTIGLSVASYAAQSQNASTDKVIKTWYAAYVNKDWNSMAAILADGFSFSSPNDDHIDITAFKERCWPNAANIKRFEVDKMIVDGDHAFVISNGWTNDGKLFRNSDYFTIKDGKLVAYECFFGPGVNYPNSGK